MWILNYLCMFWWIFQCNRVLLIWVVLRILLHVNILNRSGNLILTALLLLCIWLIAWLLSLIILIIHPIACKCILQISIWPIGNFTEYSFHFFFFLARNKKYPPKFSSCWGDSYIALIFLQSSVIKFKLTWPLIKHGIDTYTFFLQKKSSVI